MKRRESIQAISSFVCGSLIIPSSTLLINSCTSPDQELNWVPEFLEIENAFFLTEVSNTVIPNTEFPGAVALGIPKEIEKYVFNVYDEDENPVNIELLDDTSNKIIPLIEILGVKFTSRSFQLEISLKQTMIIQEKNLLSNCLIKRNNVLNHSNETEEIKSENKITFSNENNEMIDEIIDDENKEDENKEDEKEDDTEATENPSDINTNSLEILEESKEDETDNQEKEDITRIEEESLGEEIEENNKYDLEEVSIDFNNDDESVNLKKPNEVYLEIWREARKKAKDARKMAIQAYLEAKTIKTTYMLDEINNDSDDEFDDIIENLNVENTNQISLA